jgi:glucose 1-dehydrogenase
LAEELGDGNLAIEADVTDRQSLVAAAGRVQEDLGGADVLVNNAGVMLLGPFTSEQRADHRQMVEVNLLGTLLCSRRAARAMTARGTGVIVNVSSAAATLGSPGDYVHYAATKAAIDTLTVGLSKELGPDGVRVNAVAPGIIDTEMHATMGDPGRAKRAATTVPLRRPGVAEEVAAAIAWLMSDEASYTTGAVLRVSGGR